MSFKVKTAHTSSGKLKQIRKVMAKGGFVEVGVVESTVHDEAEGLTVAAIASYNEFGGPDNNPPERSFMRSTLRDEKTNIKKMNKSSLKRIVQGEMTTKKGLGLLGSYLSAKISQKIVKIRTPKNADSTLAAKYPKTNPLIDTGQLKNSINYKVTDGKLR